MLSYFFKYKIFFSIIDKFNNEIFFKLEKCYFIEIHRIIFIYENTYFIS